MDVSEAVWIMSKDVQSLPSDGGCQYFMNILFLFSLSAFPVSLMIPNCAYFRNVTSDYFEIKICRDHLIFHLLLPFYHVLWSISDFHFCQKSKNMQEVIFSSKKMYFNFSIRCPDYYYTEETDRFSVSRLCRVLSQVGLEIIN